MSKVHLHTPDAPRVACCGDATATRFASWRWQVTCTMCKLVTAPRPLDTVTEQQVRYRTDLPIRYSRLVEYVRRHSPMLNVSAAIAEFERERQIAAHCPKCGPLADPITLCDVSNNRMVFVCPTCTSAEFRERWEREA